LISPFWKGAFPDSQPVVAGGVEETIPEFEHAMPVNNGRVRANWMDIYSMLKNNKKTN
jgi:hypothetical protein